MYPERDKTRDMSRDRSRDRDKKSHRSPSQSDQYRKSRHREPQQSYRYKTKRVKFEEAPDIRVFKKEDEPSSKGLSEEEILKLKNEIEKEIAKMTFRLEDQRHIDAENERRFRKEQKDKEKALSQRLQSVQQGMGYSCPVGVVGLVSLVEAGGESQERVGHTMRINDILGCYYTSLGEIPDEPQFQLLNNNSNSECKIIKFENDHQTNNSSQLHAKRKDDKHLKGILKMPQITLKPPEHRHIDPKLIQILKDIKESPNLYPKQKMDILLDPYKKSGQLPYLLKNPQVLEGLLKNSSNPPPRQSASVSTGRQNLEGNPQGNYPGQGQMFHSFVPKADKYRTVPCKYYHSHLGCNKIDNCTYIHDQRYAGVPVPLNYSRHQANHANPPLPNPQPPIYNYGGGGMPRMQMGSGQNPPNPSYMMGNYSNPNYYQGGGANRSGNYSNPPNTGYHGGSQPNYPQNNHGNSGYYAPQSGYPPNRGDNNTQKYSGAPPPTGYPPNYNPGYGNSNPNPYPRYYSPGQGGQPSQPNPPPNQPN